MSRPPKRKAPPTSHGATAAALHAQQRLDLREPGQPTLAMVATWFLREHVDANADCGLSTKRGYRSTCRIALRHFGESAVLTVGTAHTWLRHMRDSGRVSGLTANSHRGRLHHAYVMYQQQKQATTLNPFSFPRFKADTRKLKGTFEDAGVKWQKMLEAMPDDRARAFLSLMCRRGWRPGEPLGLEWRHIAWKAPSGPVVRLEQQRREWQDVPGELKHDGLTGTFGLPAETVEYLRRAQRALREGKPMLGCATGSLVGTRPCKDGQVRQFVFPYREKHLQEILRRLRATVPEEFPWRQGFYRFRRHFAVTVAHRTGVEKVGEAKRLLRHKHLSSTDAYLRTAVGVQATPEDLAGVDAAMDSMLSPCGTTGDNVEAQNGSQTEGMRGT